MRRRSSISAANSSNGADVTARNACSEATSSIQEGAANGPIWRSAWIAMPTAIASSARLVPPMPKRAVAQSSSGSGTR